MEGNTLYPIFLKLDQLHTLIVGGGNVGLEKLSALLKNNPDARVTLVASEISDEVKELAGKHRFVLLVEKDFGLTDLRGKDLVIAATNDRATNAYIRDEAKAFRILVNVADTPDLCDFYLGSTVKKGDLKIGISTNGKSPTFAKRFRELLEEALPQDIPEILNNLKAIRDRLEGDFDHKVKRLNEITKILSDLDKNLN